jgi:hypothetical protein
MPSKIYNNKSLRKKTRGKYVIKKNKTFRKKAKKQKGGNVDEQFGLKKFDWTDGRKNANINEININIIEFNDNYCKFTLPHTANPMSIVDYTNNFEYRNAGTTAGTRVTTINKPSLYNNGMFSSEKEKHRLSVKFFKDLQLS